METSQGVFSMYHSAGLGTWRNTKVCYPCRPAYPSVFDHICMEIGRQYWCMCVFLKIWTESFQKVWNCYVNIYEFVSSEVNHWALMELSFIDIWTFPGLLYAGWSWIVKILFFKPVNSDFAFETSQQWAIFRHGGFEFKAAGDKWLHKTDKEEEKCRKPRKLALTRQQPFKKGRVGISKSSTQGALLLEKMYYSLWSRTTLADVNKIKASECHSVPVL